MATIDRLNTEQIIYNGHSIRSILNNLPKGMIKAHRNEYVKNCIAIFTNVITGYNLDYIDKLKFRNFIIVKTYYNSHNL